MDSSEKKPVVNTEIVEIIEHITRQLSPQELKTLELNTRIGTLTFKDRMLSRYACYNFITTTERAKEKATWIVKMYRPVIVADPRLNRLFIEKFRGSVFVS